jgi:hypothetical protein
MAKDLTFVEDDVLWYFLKQEEKEYYATDYPKMKQSHDAFVQELNDMRRIYLLDQLKEAKKNPNDPNIAKLVKEIKIFTGKVKGTTPEMIAKAREYPITELVKVTRGMALCPFHGDKRPSMDVRKNFYHCYSCGESGDSIDLAMKIKNLTFTQAVTFLS